jgi:flagellar hook-basal body complex protein FliE
MASPVSAAGAYAATQRLASPSGTTGLGALPGGKPGASFGDALGEVLNAVAETGKRADQQSAAAVQGKADMVDVVTAVAESQTAIETLVAVRDRVVAAYEEIMRMSI